MTKEVELIEAIKKLDPKRCLELLSEAPELFSQPLNGQGETFLSIMDQEFFHNGRIISNDDIKCFRASIINWLLGSHDQRPELLKALAEFKFTYNNISINALHFAAIIGHNSLAAVLIKQGLINIEDKTSTGDTPLLLAAKHSLDIFRYIFEKGGDLLAKNEQGETPLAIIKAIDRNGRDDFSRWLRGFGNDILQKRSSSVKKSIEKNWQWLLLPLFYDSALAIHVAAYGSSIDLLEYIITILLKNGLSIEEILNLRDSDGKTPLHHAAENDYSQAAKHLLTYSLDILAIKDNNGDTPFHLAIRSEQQTTTKLIISVNEKNPQKIGIYGTSNKKAVKKLIVRTKSKNYIEVEVGIKELGAFGVKCGDRVYTSQGLATVLGLYNKYLYFQLDSEIGATFWENITLSNTYNSDIDDKQGFQKTTEHYDLAAGDTYPKIINNYFEYKYKDKLAAIGKSLFDVIKFLQPLFIGTPEEYFDSIKQKEFWQIQKLLEDIAGAAAAILHGKTLLHFVAQTGQLEALKLILKENPADLYAKDMDGNTPLHFAAKACQKEAVVLLLQAGASLSCKNNAGHTPLEVGGDAFIKLKQELIDHIINAGDDITNVNNFIAQTPQWLYLPLTEDGRTAIHIAAAYGKTALLKRLSEKILMEWYNLPPDKRAITQVDKHGMSAIFYAVANNQLSAVEFLLAQGFNVNEKDKSDNTLLHIAVKNNNKEMADFLISQGASLTAKNNAGKMPAELYANKNHLTEQCKVLSTAILQTASKDKEESIKAQQTIEAFIKQNKQWLEFPLDKDDNTAMHYAAIAKNPALVELITDNLETGSAMLKQPNKIGLSPLHHVALQDQAFTEHLIKKYQIQQPGLTQNSTQVPAITSTQISVEAKYLQIRNEAVIIYIKDYHLCTNQPIDKIYKKAVVETINANPKKWIKQLYGQDKLSFNIFKKLVKSLPEAFEVLWNLLDDMYKKAILVDWDFKFYNKMMWLRPDLFKFIWGKISDDLQNLTYFLESVIIHSPLHLLANKEIYNILAGAIIDSQGGIIYKYTSRLLRGTKLFAKYYAKKDAALLKDFINMLGRSAGLINKYTIGIVYLRGLFGYESDMNKAANTFEEIIKTIESSIPKSNSLNIPQSIYYAAFIRQCSDLHLPIDVYLSALMELANIYLLDEQKLNDGIALLQKLNGLADFYLSRIGVKESNLNHILKLQKEATELLEQLNFTPDDKYIVNESEFTVSLSQQIAEETQLSQIKPAGSPIDKNNSTALKVAPRSLGVFSTQPDRIQNHLFFRLKEDLQQWLNNPQMGYNRRENNARKKGFFEQQKAYLKNKSLIPVVDMVKKICEDLWQKGKVNTNLSIPGQPEIQVKLALAMPVAELKATISDILQNLRKLQETMNAAKDINRNSLARLIKCFADFESAIQKLNETTLDSRPAPVMALRS
jgi:ankyrin repeat protein